MSEWPCRNPSCSSYGRPHPHCNCPRPMAEGGEIQCSGNHQDGCEYQLPQPEEMFHNSILSNGLSKVLKNNSKSNLDDLEQPERPFKSYISSSQSGAKKLQSAFQGVFGDSPELNGDPERLSEHLNSLDTDPAGSLNVGSKITNISPEHGVQFASHLATAQSYINSIKPQNTPTGPLEKPAPPSKASQLNYQRQLRLVEQPGHIMEAIKQGMLLPQDIQTVSTVYPGLYSRMKRAVGEQMVEAKVKGKHIPYKSRLALSMFLGEPVGNDLNPASIQAAIAANAPKAPPQPPAKKKKPSSEASISQQDKVNQLYETPTQSRDSVKRE